MKKILLPAMALITMFSCKKEKEDCSISMESISGRYTLEAHTFKPNPLAAEVDLFKIEDACVLDDLYVFTFDGKFTREDKGSKCNPAGNISGPWTLSGKRITFPEYSGVIESFDCKSLVLVRKDDLSIGEFRMTLVKY